LERFSKFPAIGCCESSVQSAFSKALGRTDLGGREKAGCCNKRRLHAISVGGRRVGISVAAPRLPTNTARRPEKPARLKVRIAPYEAVPWVFPYLRPGLRHPIALRILWLLLSDLPCVGPTTQATCQAFLWLRASILGGRNHAERTPGTVK